MADFELVRLKKEDCNELVSFLNDVFTLQNGRKMHFEKEVPRIYRENDETMSWHIAAKKDGKIIGCAGTYPLIYKVGGEKIKIGSVESVAVDPSCRGMGIMQKMMANMEEDNITKYDLCFLQGDRMRYSHFGFDRCGMTSVFNIKMSGLGKDAPKENYTFERVKDKNDILLKRIYDFYITQNVARVREFDIFYDSMTTHGLIIHAVIDKKGEVCGYFLVDDSFTGINEIGLKNADIFQDVFKCYMLLKKISLIYIAMPLYHMLFNKANEFCDRFQLSQPGCYKINNFKKVLESYMREKSKCEKMCDGTLTIDSELFGKWSVSKKGENICVEEFKGEAQISVSSKDTYQFFFSALGGKFTCEDKDAYLLAKDWFPLPLYTPPML